MVIRHGNKTRKLNFLLMIKIICAMSQIRLILCAISDIMSAVVVIDETRCADVFKLRQVMEVVD
jgi:hypothetical protein